MFVRELLTKWGFEVDDAALERMESGIKNIKSLAIIGASAIAGMTAEVGYFAKKAGEQEQVRVGFETIMGSAEKAEAMLSSLAQFASKTPFTLLDVQDNARMLMAMGITGDKIIPTMKALGDVSAGLNVPLQRLAWNYGQIRTIGKLTGRDLRDMSAANVPMLEYLGKVLKKSEAEVQAMVSGGKVKFTDVEAAFALMSSEGERFGNLMFKQSGTLLGMMSNLEDHWDQMAITIGNQVLPKLKLIAMAVLKWADANRKIIAQRAGNILKIMADYLVLVLGSIFKLIRFVFELTDKLIGLERAAKLVLAVFSVLFGATLLWSMGAIVQGVFSIIKAISLMGKATMLLNVKALAIPILIGAAIAAVLLIFEDFWSFLQGRNSVIGLLLEQMFGKERMLAIRDTIKMVVSEIVSVFKFLWEILSTEGMDALKELWGFLGQVVSDIGASFSEIWKSLQDILSLIGLDGIETFSEFAKIIGGTLLSTAIEALKLALMGVYTAFTFVIDAIKLMFQLSRELRNAFYGMVSAIAGGIDTLIGKLRSFMMFLLDNKVGRFLLDKIGMDPEQINDTWGRIQNTASDVKNFMDDRRNAGMSEAATGVGRGHVSSTTNNPQYNLGGVNVNVPFSPMLNPKDVGNATHAAVSGALWQFNLDATAGAYGAGN